MSSSAPECPTCGRTDFESELGVKYHHKQAHDESLVRETYECEVCGDEFDARKDEPAKTCSYDCHGKYVADVRIQEKYSRHELVSEMQNLAAELGETPRRRDMSEHGKFSIGPYYREFDTWPEAVRAAGLQPSRESSISNSKLLAEMQRVAGEIGHAPTKKQMTSHGKYSYGVYQNRFGSWSDAIREAGLELEPKQHHSIPQDELIGAVQTVAEITGRPPTKDTVNELGEYSERAYLRHWDSWADVRAAADFPRVLKGRHHWKWSGGKPIYDSVKQLLGSESWKSTREEHTRQNCRMCGSPENLHLHHIIPIMAGGTNEEWNLMTLCASCHARVESRTREFVERVLVE